MGSHAATDFTGHTLAGDKQSPVSVTDTEQFILTITKGCLYICGPHPHHCFWRNTAGCRPLECKITADGLPHHIERNICTLNPNVRSGRETQGEDFISYLELFIDGLGGVVDGQGEGSAEFDIAGNIQLNIATQFTGNTRAGNQKHALALGEAEDSGRTCGQMEVHIAGRKPGNTAAGNRCGLLKGKIPTERLPEDIKVDALTRDPEKRPGPYIHTYLIATKGKDLVDGCTGGIDLQ